MKKIKLFLLLSLLLNLSGFSQKIVLIEKDTFMVFSLPRARFLLNQTVKVREQSELIDILRAQYRTAREVIENDSVAKVALSGINRNMMEAVGLKDVKIRNLETSVEAGRRALVWQKVQKWVAVALIPVVGYAGFRVGQTF